MAHAHEGLAELVSPTLASHVQHYHATDRQTHDLHWHWLMPWELASRNTPSHEPSPIALPPGLGSGVRGDGVASSDSIWAENTCGPADWGFIAPLAACAAAILPAPGLAASQSAGASFTQTYRGVSLRSLVCVCLC